MLRPLSKFAVAFEAQQAEERLAAEQRANVLYRNSTKDRRRAKRNEVYESVEIQVRRDRVVGTILNLSENGVFVNEKNELKVEVGDIVTILLSDGIYLQGSVAWVGIEGLGIKFTTALATIDDIVHLENRGRAVYQGMTRSRRTSPPDQC